MAFGNRGKGPISEINVTPMVDVMLVLLVIFMMSAPLMFNGVKLTLPKTQKVHTINLNSDQIILSVSTKGEFFLGKEKITFDKLDLKIKEKLATAKKRVLFLRADYDIKYGKIAQLIAYLKRSGIVDIALVTELEKKKKRK
jgi:biopolymer transport protein TolR